MPEFNNTVRKGLQIAMARADVDASELAERSGVSYAVIRQYLRGETAPLLETASKLAEALGCTPNDLCGFSDQ